MDYQKLLEYRNLRNRFTQKLQIELTAARLGYARVEKTVTDDDLNPMGFAHGGLYFTMADNAAGSAAATHGIIMVTSSANYNYYRSAQSGDRLVAEATELKYGQTLAVYDVRVTDQSGTLLGSGTFTFCSTGQPLNL